MHVSYRYLLIIVLVAALLCLMPARGADAPDEKKPQTAAAQSVESAEAPDTSAPVPAEKPSAQSRSPDAISPVPTPVQVIFVRPSGLSVTAHVPPPAPVESCDDARAKSSNGSALDVPPPPAVAR